MPKTIIVDDIPWYIPFKQEADGKWVQDGSEHVCLRSDIEKMPDVEIEIAKRLKRAELCFKISIVCCVISVICSIIMLLR